jgi:hypothetical protein
MVLIDAVLFCQLMTTHSYILCIISMMVWLINHMKFPWCG